MQILGCELHKNAFGGRAVPGPAGAELPRPVSRYNGREGMGRKGLGIGRVRKGMGMEGWEEVER